ncbi:MAG: hypothetical protein KatS3mg027_1274 [Bacteroidia bacterium]|nr:MAG: hypothetical protein KatS3mg027_1274 [Bacteroidia bacterium]
MIIFKKYILTLILLSIVFKYNALIAQLLQLNIYDNAEKKIIYSQTIKNIVELNKISRDFILSYQKQGYLLADYDSITVNENVHTFYFNKHTLFYWIKLSKGNLEKKLYYEYFQPKKFEHKPVKYNEIQQLFEKIITYYENNGYPFATIKLDSIQIDNNSLSASLMVNTYQKIIIDSILLQGNLKLNKKFLYKYIDIKPNSVYSEKKLRQIESKLRKLPFVNIRQSPIIRITDKYNKVYIFADNRNVSQFDGIAGLQPDVTGKTIFTGNLKIKLINTLFHHAEQVDMEWQRVQPLTQNFKFMFAFPYIAGTAIGTSYQIILFKKDTTFIDVQNQLSISYYFSGINRVDFFYKQRNTNLISTFGLSGITTLPDYADVTTKNYGLGILYNALNNPNNPSSGYFIQINFSVGNKTIHKNPQINDAAYKNILLQSIQYQSEGNIEYFIPKIITKYSTLKLSVKYGFINGNSNLFKNELFRIGGLKSIRGFNEQSIFADRYAIPTLEYRFLYSENGYLMLFADAAYYTTRYFNQFSETKLYAFGSGIQFETKAGLVNLFYAVGNEFGKAPDFRIGKIHAGLISVF